MLLNANIWKYLTGIILHFLIIIKPLSSQGVSCYKCMTTDPTNDACQDPFSSLLNPIQNDCQATSVGKIGTFPARYCVKITGRVTSVDPNANASYLNAILYYRTCVIDNIMDSTKSLETTGNFRLQGLQGMQGSIRLQGFMSLCTADGCNHSNLLHSSLSTIIISLLLTRYISGFYY
ncbi:unnamed protein product [Adineta steineri]|uniref:Uncharacterized protein n=1 Tax=Adineta steineri TaxID=433720 RepID=A0A818L006_9BILA|nr:unnamed protein product [Adineta steineri]CAF1245081.1 unnamed protein product [Adineta steineri]CAF3564468.1 unnamed protein product [Adineta steineri]CAF3607568.1 unnamed protein product [Adineta steineri]